MVASMILRKLKPTLAPSTILSRNTTRVQGMAYCAQGRDTNALIKHQHMLRCRGKFVESRMRRAGNVEQIHELVFAVSPLLSLSSTETAYRPNTAPLAPNDRLLCGNISHDATLAPECEVTALHSNVASDRP